MLINGERVVTSQKNGALVSGSGGDAILVFARAGAGVAPKKASPSPKVSPSPKATKKASKTSPSPKKASKASPSRKTGKTTTTTKSKCKPKSKSKSKTKTKTQTQTKVLSPATGRWVLAKGAVAKAMKLE
jgi:hypothetical protein